MLPRSSDSSDNEKRQVEKLEIERRGSTASRVESLHDLPDPDAGKSPEERAKIVWTSDLPEIILTDLVAGQGAYVEG